MFIYLPIYLLVPTSTNIVLSCLKTKKNRQRNGRSTIDSIDSVNIDCIYSVNGYGVCGSTDGKRELTPITISSSLKFFPPLACLSSLH